MQTWEYKTVKVATKGFRGGFLDTAEFDGELNRLGRDGWELVATFDTNMLEGVTREAVAVFKRPHRRESPNESVQQAAASKEAGERDACPDA